MSRLPTVCADRSGFLFAHACDRPPASVCATCGKPICLEHTRMTQAGPTCITCLRRQDDDTASDCSDSSRSSGSGTSTSTDSEAEPDFRPAGGQFGGAGATAEWGAEAPAAAREDPYFYGAAADRESYYDADDFRAFDVATAAAAAADADQDTETDAPETDTGAS